ncbi:cytochrome P450 [Tothia fuscella]|uniref:Cytochrome P450 n=1 Tax=Tothia fuscella TaxID=1048955 RepID=A0A9P4NKY9_9PEZI|nr:cytochrome P450 [Tothia fuscella]
MSASHGLTTILAVAVAATLFVSYSYKQITLYLSRRKFANENGCKPLRNYYPLKDPVFGIDNIIANVKAAKKSRLLARSYGNFNKYGDTFGSKLFAQKIILTREPQNVKTILSLRFKDFGIGSRETALGPLLGQGIFTMDGAFWQHSRAMIRPNFARDQVADLEAFERHIQDLWKLIPRDGSTVDLQELFFRFTIDSATEFLFGESTDTLKETKSGGLDGARFATAFNDAQDACAMNTRLGPLRHFNSNPKGKEAMKFCHEFVGQFVDKAIQFREQLDLEKQDETEEKYVFLHQLAKDTMDKKRLQDELLNVLLAGRDTTASLLSNMWFMLAKQPEIFAKLRQEVEETLNGELPTYDVLRSMKYLKFCMNESLRLHPVVPGNSRMAMHDSVLPLGGGPDGQSPVFVSKGTLVVYSPYSMHRRQDFFGDDSEEFKPERWENLRPGWEYLPFNGGPRICLGQQYALTEAGYVTVRLCQEFKELQSRDDEPWMEKLTLTLCSKNGTLVGLTPVSG